MGTTAKIQLERTLETLYRKIDSEKAENEELRQENVLLKNSKQQPTEQTEALKNLQQENQSLLDDNRKLHDENEKLQPSNDVNQKIAEDENKIKVLKTPKKKTKKKKKKKKKKK